MAEIPFEAGLAALEATRGTAIAAPTHYTTGTTVIKPMMTDYAPDESRGVLAARTRDKVIRMWSETTESGAVDLDYWPFLLNRVVKGNVTAPTTPVGATDSRLWTFARDMTADTIESASLWSGDPSVQVFRAAYCMADELTISADASGEDGVTFELTGMGKFPEQVADPTLPTQIIGDLLAPGNMQVWLDTSSAIGTTLLTDRVVSAEITIPTGVTYKYLASGTLDTLTYSRTGRTKTSPEISLTFELPDMVQYDLMAANSLVKLRVRMNGDLIEVGFRRYFEIDTWGRLRMDDWGELEESNRTMTLTLTSTYDTTAATDLIARVQNDRDTL
jgi:hypothetical protein